MAKRMVLNSLRFHLVTLFPEMFSALNYGITGRAQQSGILEYYFYNPRDYTLNKQKRVDDSPYGGGPGQVMQVQPLRDAIKAAKNHIGNSSSKTIYLSPQGRLLTQNIMQHIYDEYIQHCVSFILISGRYEGIDQRIIDQDIDEEYSIGDYVLSGGELAAMVFIDALTRLHPAALGDPESAKQDSFAHLKGLLDYPHYTRPEEIDGQKVPKILLSGNHTEIQRWQLQQSLGNTYLKRPEIIEILLKNNRLNQQEQLLLQNFIENLTKLRSQ